MVDSQFAKARKIAEEAMATPDGERRRYLVEACGDDETLRASVEQMIKDAQESIDYLEDLDLDLTVKTTSSDRTVVPDRIGPFTVTRQIASGGWSVVYEGRQDNPDRRVAIKVLHSSLTSTSALQRFAYEAEVLARLRHPGIAEIYHAGTFDTDIGRRPYFAMELLEKAMTLQEWASHERLSIDNRLKLFAELCDIVHYGHTRGVVHCDLKPDNIMIDRDGRLHVIDFGIAMAAGDEGLQPSDITDTGRIVGTIQYMAPEQFAGDLDRIDARTDVRALGVVLYQLLTGQKPWNLSGLPSHEAIRTVQEKKPPSARQHDPRLRGDLDTIISTAMRNEAGDRYGSALELRQDIDRYRASLPIQARPPGPLRAAHLFVRRHRVGVGITAFVALAICAALVMSLVAWHRSNEATRHAQQAAQEAMRETERATSATEFLTEMFSLAHPAVAAGGVIGVERMLDEATEFTATAYQDDPDAAAHVRMALARIQLGVGDLDGAAINLALLPPHTSPGTHASLEGEVLRARLEHVRGEVMQAESRLRTIIEQTDMKEQPAFIEALGTLALVRIERLDYEEAAGLLREAIPRAIDVLGTEDARTIELQATLGRVNAALTMFNSPHAPPGDEMKPYGDLDRVVSALGPTHPATFLIRLSEMDHAFLAEGPGAGTVQRLRGIHRDADAALGPLHPRTLECSIELAQMLAMTGEHEEADSLLRSSIAAYDVTLGPAHSNAALGRLHLGMLLLNEGGDQAEAAEVLGRSWQANYTLWGNEDPRTIDAEAGLAIAMLRLDRFQEAQMHARSALVAMVESPMVGRRELYWLLRRELLDAARRAGKQDLAASEEATILAEVEAHLDPESPLARQMLKHATSISGE